MFPTKYSWPFLFFWPLKYAICFQQNIPGHFFWLLKYAICFQQNIPGHFLAHQICSMFSTKYSWPFLCPSDMLYVCNKIFLAILFGPSNMLYVFNKIFLAIFLAHQICSMFSTKNHWPCSMPIRHALCFQQNIPGNIQRPLNIPYTSKRI